MIALVIPVKRKLNPANVRAQCGLNASQLAKAVPISRTIIHNAEHKIPISRTSAYRILEALNPIRQQKGLPEVDIDDLSWIIYGDGRARKT